MNRRIDRKFVRMRRETWVAVCALTLMFAWVRAGQAQDAAADSTAKNTASVPAKPAKPKAISTAAHKATTSTPASSSAKKSTRTSRTTATGTHSRKKTPLRARGQQKIDSERATSIQQALIREHYLSGEPTGTWNQASEDAMRKYQADHGWQSKEVPDSRALIKLGLGPSNDHLLNPQSAMITKPDSPRSESGAPTSHTSPPTADPTPALTPAQKTSQNDLAPQ